MLTREIVNTLSRRCVRGIALSRRGHRWPPTFAGDARTCLVRRPADRADGKRKPDGRRTPQKTTSHRAFPMRELKARAAWHYYVEGLTQEQISDLLGIGRIKVHRILSAAREEGIVQFRIRDSVVKCVIAGAAAQGALRPGRSGGGAVRRGKPQRAAADRSCGGSLSRQQRQRRRRDRARLGTHPEVRDQRIAAPPDRRARRSCRCWAG